MKRTFDGPVGTIEYELVKCGYTTRRIVADGVDIGVLRMTKSQKWRILGQDTLLFSSQRTAAEYRLMWWALLYQNVCPHCKLPWPWETDPNSDQKGRKSALWTCPRYGGSMLLDLWPPERLEGELRGNSNG